MNRKNIIAIILTLSIGSLFFSCEEEEPPEGLSSYQTFSLENIDIDVELTNLGYTNANIMITVINTGGRKINQMRLFYAQGESVDTNSLCVELGSINAYAENTVKSVNLTGLNHNSTYTMFLVSNYSLGQIIGTEQMSFRTLLDTRLPEVNTSGADAVTTSTVSLYGRIEKTGDGYSSVNQHGHVWATHNNPKLEDNKSTLGTGRQGDYLSSVTNLQSGTKYYYCAYATNDYATSYGEIREFTTNDIIGYGTLSDYDGNKYKTVIIGEQTWMAENLKVTHYPDGAEIPLITENSTWENLTFDSNNEAYCYYNNNSNGEKDIYGALYTYASAEKVCPTGWHLPSYLEIEELINYVRNDSENGELEASYLKSVSGWDLNGNGTNAYGFSALPGGKRDQSSGFRVIQLYGVWWTSTLYYPAKARTLSLSAYTEEIQIGNPYNQLDGLSVRCVKD